MTKVETEIEKHPKAKKKNKKRTSGVSDGKNVKKRKKRSSETSRKNVSTTNKRSNSTSKNTKGVSRKKRPSTQSGRKQTEKKRKQRKSNKVITALFDILFFLFILLMLGGAAVFTISEKNDKSFYGYRFYEVYTNSMRKTQDNQKGNFVAGDMIIVKIEEPEKIDVGDIITFVPNQQSPDTYLTHRVIAKEEPEKSEPEVVDGEVQISEHYPVFTTQGDANNKSDPPVRGDRVIGVVQFAIPKAGTVLKFIRENTIPVVVMVVSFFLLVILLRQYFAPEKEQPGEQKRGYDSLPASKKRRSKDLYK
ncbi:signal peptidase I [Enterococcus sp. BWR-S5]|uniref:signal peptidase I n=1 Tax=Enterococcus sp. BWR-S5 TaxID=2787714 RepID=UPI001922E15B|nr:signal peptidase I [Enterococcus sp. BWR-S5]MBL1226779.1 signal peptidase I [Enterococcus sp. BWR-S5]